MTTEPDRIERALELFLFAPIGAALSVRDAAPSVVSMLVARGRAEVDRRQEQVEQRIRTARSLGEVALAFGLPQLRKDAEQRLEGARARAGEFLGSFGARPNGASSRPAPVHAVQAVRDDPADTSNVAPTAPTADDDAAGPRSERSAHLPIPGYDSLSASQVVERLAGLARPDLASVREYEVAHRNRRTILGKIDQLTA